MNYKSIFDNKKQINGQNGFANKIEVKNNQQLGWQPKPQDVKENYHVKQDPNPIRQVIFSTVVFS